MHIRLYVYAARISGLIEGHSSLIRYVYFKVNILWREAVISQLGIRSVSQFLLLIPFVYFASVKADDCSETPKYSVYS